MVSEPYSLRPGATTPVVPMEAAAYPACSQIWRVKAATEVLPLVPVTATIVSGCSGKKRAAASANASRGSSTTRTGTGDPERFAFRPATTATAEATLSASTLPNKLGGVQVIVGGLLASLYYASPDQVNFVIPAALLPGRTTVTLVRQATATRRDISLVSAAPALYVLAR